jgi:hypothetical protein
LVIGGNGVALGVGLAFGVLAGVVVSASAPDSGDVVFFFFFFFLVLGALLPALDSAAGAGVGCGETGGAWTVAVAAVRVSDLSSGTTWPTANDGLGAGPIAAPTATPIASIPTASTAVTRAEGARK